MDFADLHSHSAPGVDDGCRSMNESLETLSQFAGAGVGHVVCTPHLSLPYLKSPLALNDAIMEHALAIEELREEAAGCSDSPRIYSGQEIWAPRAVDVLRVAGRNDVGIADNRFLLVEFGFRPGYEALEVIEAVRSEGREILIAHPERYPFASEAEPIDVISEWVEKGAFLQVNLGSFFGTFRGWGGQSEWLSWQIVERGLAHVVASDHHGEHRPQILHERFRNEMVARGAAAAVADQLMRDNPKRILRGERPGLVPAIEQRSRAEVAA